MTAIWKTIKDQNTRQPHQAAVVPGFASLVMVKIFRFGLLVGWSFFLGLWRDLLMPLSLYADTASGASGPQVVLCLLIFIFFLLLTLIFAFVWLLLAILLFTPETE